MNDSIIKERIQESIDVKQKILKDQGLLDTIVKTAEVMLDCIRNGSKILFCGNGGSASDAVHLAAELIGKFEKVRKPIAGIALNTDMSALTAISNDFGYDYIFERQVEALLKPGDVLVGISCSGNSESVLRAVKKARELGGITVGMTGHGGGKLKDMADIAIVVPSDRTARIQESHITIGHILCEIVEAG